MCMYIRTYTSSISLFVGQKSVDKPEKCGKNLTFFR